MSEADVMEPPAPFQGWLHKRGEQGLKLWKKRWFALRNEKIYYFKKATDNSQHLGSINMADVVFIGPTKDLNKTGNTAYFEVQTKSGRVYHLWSEVASESQQWLDVLSQSKKYCDYKAAEQIRQERERQQTLREEQLAREEALQRPASEVLPPTASFGELLGRVEAKPIHRIVAASTPDYRKQQESLLDLQKEIATVAHETQKKEKESPAYVPPPEPEKIPKLVISAPANAPSTPNNNIGPGSKSPIMPVNVTPTLTPSSTSTIPSMSRTPTSNSSLPTPNNVPQQSYQQPYQQQYQQPNQQEEREEFIPNLSNLPSLKLGTPANDGHLAVGGGGLRRPSQEMHNQVGGEWRNSSINGDDLDDEEDLDSVNRCCHITCYIL